MTRTKRLLAVVCTVALAAAACGGGDTTADAAAPSSVPTTGVERGGSTSSTSSTQPDGVVEPDFTDVSAEIDRFVDAEGLNGAGLVIVDRDDGVIFEHYAGVFGPDRISLIASSSKMLTAGVLMRLHDRGELDVDAPVLDATGWGDDANPEITPVQLVSNSSGLIGLGPEANFVPYLCQYVATGTLQECGQAIFETPEDDELVVPPDTEFRYGGAQWQVAGAVAEIASGRSWAELIEETYVEPCGVDSLAYNNHYTQISGSEPFRHPSAFDGDPSVLAETDNPSMEGGAYISAPDYASLLLMHLRGGVCGDERVLTEESVDRMHADRIGPAYDGDTESSEDGYGLGWWVDRDDPARISDGGAFGSMPWLDLDRGYGAYLVVEATNDVGQKLSSEIRPTIDAEIDRLDS